ncbi:unnamed protein product [Lathyrus sativus]|nr:unnamed protein product [Lathyrus sativus]
MKLKAIFPLNQSSEVFSGKIQNLGLIRILEYTLNDIPNKSDKYLFVIKCESVSPALEAEIKSEQPSITLKPKEGSGIDLKPKQGVVSKSAAQIVQEQHGNSAPAA